MLLIQKITKFFYQLGFFVVFFQKTCFNAWKNIKKHPVLSFSSISTLTLVLFFFHSSINLKFLVKDFIQEISKKTSVIVEINNNYDYYAVKPLIKKLQNISGVDQVKFYDKNQELKDFSTKYSNIKLFLEKYSFQNPLPSTIEISATKIEVLNKVINILNQVDYRDLVNQKELNNNFIQKDNLKKMSQIVSFIKKISKFFLSSVIISFILVVFSLNILIMYAKKEDILKILNTKKHILYIKTLFIIESLYYVIIAFFSLIIINFFFYFISVQNIYRGQNSLSLIQNFLWPKSFSLFLEGGILIASTILANILIIEIFLYKSKKIKFFK